MSELTQPLKEMLGKFLEPDSFGILLGPQYSIDIARLKRQEYELCEQLERLGLVCFYEVMPPGCFNSGIHVYHLTKQGLQYFEETTKDE